MNRILYLIAVFISIGQADSMMENQEPRIVFQDKTPMKLREVQSSDLKEIPLHVLEGFRKDLKQLTDILGSMIQQRENEEISEEITPTDAYFAINGVKMDLKDALTQNPQAAGKLVKNALSTLEGIEQEYRNILGYDYCLAILLRHFPDSLTDEHYQKFFHGMPEDKQRTGLELMKQAASGDDGDAASYLRYHKK